MKLCADDCYFREVKKKKRSIVGGVKTAFHISLFGRGSISIHEKRAVHSFCKACCTAWTRADSPRGLFVLIVTERPVESAAKETFWIVQQPVFSSWNQIESKHSVK